MTVSEILDTLNLGFPGALAAIGLYVFLRGEFVFRYPARKANRSDEKES
jgi:hypothetical protein